MAIIDLFSKRNAKERGEISDVYNYDEIPQPLRIQIIHIWNETLGNSSEYWDTYSRIKDSYKFIDKALCREYGRFSLTSKFQHRDINYYEDLTSFLLEETDSEKVIDALNYLLK